MAGVRLVANVFGVVGWLTLIIGGLGLLGIAMQVGSALGARGGGGLASVGTVIVGAVPLVALAIGPFFLWALLTGLCELHAQGTEILFAVRSGSGVMAAPAMAARQSGAVATSAPQEVVVSRADMTADRKIVCPRCGTATDQGKDNCKVCGVRLVLQGA